MTALSDRSYTTDRDTARQSRKGATLYPRVMVLGSTWVRQDYAGGPMVCLPNGEAVRLLLPDEAAA